MMWVKTLKSGSNRARVLEKEGGRIGNGVIPIHI